MQPMDILVGAAVLAACGGVCVCTCLSQIGRPLSKRWIQVEAELRPSSPQQQAYRQASNAMIGMITGGSPAHRVEENELFDAVYYVENAEYHQTVRNTGSDGTIRFYVDRTAPNRVWSPKLRMTRPQAAGVLLTCAMLICFTLYMFLR